jgi:hypothetical protein
MGIVGTYILWSYGIFYGHLVYVWPFGNLVVIWYIFPRLVNCAKKNLATLFRRGNPKNETKKN